MNLRGAALSSKGFFFSGFPLRVFHVKLNYIFRMVLQLAPLCHIILRVKCFYFHGINIFLFQFRAKRKKDMETISEKRHRLQGRRTVEEDKNYYKQFPCKRFRTGDCEYGETCKYSHDINLKINEHENCEDANHSNDKGETNTADTFQ